MDKKSLFQSLVTNKYMPDFDYFTSSFSFQTVFHLSPYSSHCCPCAFEHEYLDYISDSGERDEAVYEKIANCIRDGRCPHVDAAPHNHVTETKIYGIHIAAAVGTEQVVQGNRLVLRDGPVGVFGVNPIHMAVLKNQPNMLRKLLHIYPQSPFNQFLFYSHRKSKISCNIQVEHISLTELCTRMESSELLRTFLCVSPTVLGISNSFKYLFRHNLKVLQDVLLDFKEKIRTEGRRCCEAAVVFNDPHVLDEILKYLSTLPDFKNDQKQLYTLCSRLQREECAKILFFYRNRLEQTNESDENYIEYMIGLLLSYHDRLKDEIVPMLKQIPCTTGVMNRADKHSPSQLHLYLLNEYPRLNTGIINSLFELGADVNVLYTEKQTALHHLISLQKKARRLFYQKVRATIEVFLDRNPDMQMYRNIKPETFEMSPIGLAVTIDLRLNLTPCMLDWSGCMLYWSGSLKIDGNTHTYSGHEITETYALNFFVPLLIECGMPYSREHLQDAPKCCLHPIEQEYIQNCLDKPRSLKLRCRDVLREFYKGMHIHTFVHVSEIPKSLKDYILLKPVLLLCKK